MIKLNGEISKNDLRRLLVWWFHDNAELVKEVGNHPNHEGYLMIKGRDISFDNLENRLKYFLENPATEENPDRVYNAAKEFRVDRSQFRG